MIQCVAISKRGKGTSWLFHSIDEARRHPLTQPDPLVLRNSSDLRNPDFLDSFPDYRDFVAAGDLEGVWEKVVRDAKDVPVDPDEVIELVQRERGITMEKTVAKAAAAGTAPAAEKPKKEKKEKPPQTVRGHQMTATMAFGIDKEGKTYGPKNNPKREGSASAARFALYKPGKALSAQLGMEGGPTLDDLKFDSDPKRNWIVIND